MRVSSNEVFVRKNPGNSATTVTVTANKQPEMTALSKRLDGQSWSLEQLNELIAVPLALLHVTSRLLLRCTHRH